ncbi:MAG: hypothetical protein M5U19_21690 [Microthrixaceae bacterium]|nr:hypothetical protein [Microthrixaceae bacterium]
MTITGRPGYHPPAVADPVDRGVQTPLLLLGPRPGREPGAAEHLQLPAEAQGLVALPTARRIEDLPGVFADHGMQGLDRVRVAGIDPVHLRSVASGEQLHGAIRVVCAGWPGRAPAVAESSPKRVDPVQHHDRVAHRSLDHASPRAAGPTTSPSTAPASTLAS